ncbi:uncharacterized protein AMSG_06792 [Thecamonas trahens ATCC 50062]|uniref:C3H1-type domain-containing protein n=1 Tax=Thecamonas trahens ATCC 50062 TaxID=461836 RepID=A0A0L0DDU2_THETB|nr:hypothetical protein AMSG_06792 [Thecamonas trahens ATCC 50062]KNC50311.1 hypothetical protein AMSG_06792 [Thecamonas trahens ATCC 50062]|eukprot:XP_013756858.1 hypothetical protein AMSG_06792 [Thecamonas trahens ATCC 50062]
MATQDDTVVTQNVAGGAAAAKAGLGQAGGGVAKAGEAKAGEAKAGEAKAGEAKAGEAKAGEAKSPQSDETTGSSPSSTGGGSKSPGSGGRGRRRGGRKRSGKGGKGNYVSPSSLKGLKISPQELFKTALCIKWMNNPESCPYGEECSFAHGESELREPPPRVPKEYKTKLCALYHASGWCPYGKRCHFIHPTDRIQPKDSTSHLRLLADERFSEKVKSRSRIHSRAYQRKLAYERQQQRLREQQLHGDSDACDDTGSPAALSVAISDGNAPQGQALLGANGYHAPDGDLPQFTAVAWHHGQGWTGYPYPVAGAGPGQGYPTYVPYEPYYAPVPPPQAMYAAHPATPAMYYTHPAPAPMTAASTSSSARLSANENAQALPPHAKPAQASYPLTPTTPTRADEALPARGSPLSAQAPVFVPRTLAN